MARIELRPDLIASRYEGVPAGPRLLYSFETQEGIPVDGGDPLLRELSPFSIRFIPPRIYNVPDDAQRRINLIQRAFASNEVFQDAARQVRNTFGIDTVAGQDQRSVQLQQIVAAGQVTSGVTGDRERTVLVDRFTAADIANQIDTMLRVPPLTLLVNPREMSVNHTSIQQYTNRTRHGFIYERWGESQPTASFSGSTGAFIAAGNAATGQGPNTQQTRSPTGVQFASKRDSAAWQNFMALYHVYRNNGYVYDTIGGTEAHLMIGSVAISYDQVTYLGHIDSFDYSYDANQPHRIEWSMEFTINEIYDNADSPLVVQPMRAANPNPSYPGRPGQTGFDERSTVSGLPGLGVSGAEHFAQTPLDLFIPGGQD